MVARNSSDAPFRVLDTRTAHDPFAGRATRSVDIRPSGLTPATATSAVELTVTIVSPTSAGYLSVYEDGTNRPATSSVNFAAGQTAAATVFTAHSNAGKVDLYLGSAGAANVLVDVDGYFAAGTPTVAGAFRVVTPSRMSAGTAAAGATATVPLAGHAGIPSSGVEAVALTVTANRPMKTGYLVAHASGTTRPGTSSQNYLPGQNVANMVVTPLGSDGAVNLDNVSTGSTPFVVDVLGYFLGGTPTAAGAYVPVTPTRLVDTRSQAAVSYACPGFGGSDGPLPAAGQMQAVVVNTTADAATYAGDIRVSGARPVDEDSQSFGTSTLNFPAQHAVADLASTPSIDGGDNLNTVAACPEVGSAHRTSTVRVVLDVLGYYRA